MSSRSKTPVTGTLTTSRFGSLAQTAYTTRVWDDVQVNPLIRISSKRGVTHNYSQAGANVASGAAIFRYRVQRRSQNFKDMLRYRTVQEAAALWLGNENIVFQAGAENLWNTSQFTMGEQPGRQLVYSLSMRSRHKTTHE
jgi:hypothetical protein